MSFYVCLLKCCLLNSLRRDCTTVTNQMEQYDLKKKKIRDFKKKKIAAFFGIRCHSETLTWSNTGPDSPPAAIGRVRPDPQLGRKRLLAQTLIKFVVSIRLSALDRVESLKQQTGKHQQPDVVYFFTPPAVSAAKTSHIFLFPPIFGQPYSSRLITQTSVRSHVCRIVTLGSKQQVCCLSFWTSPLECSEDYTVKKGKKKKKDRLKLSLCRRCPVL